MSKSRYFYYRYILSLRQQEKYGHKQTIKRFGIGN